MSENLGLDRVKMRSKAFCSFDNKRFSVVSFRLQNSCDFSWEL